MRTNFTLDGTFKVVNPRRAALWLAAMSALVLALAWSRRTPRATGIPANPPAAARGR